MFAERWTIDEIGDGIVRVLAARSVAPDAVAPLATESRAITPTALGEASRDVVMAIELGTPSPTVDGAAEDATGGVAEQADSASIWTEEQDSVLDVTTVADFLSEFGELTPAVARPLREADVFWVVATDAPARPLSEGPVRRSETAAVLDAYRAVQPVVHDMTAPARQASKVLYHDTFRKAEERS